MKKISLLFFCYAFHLSAQVVERPLFKTNFYEIQKEFYEEHKNEGKTISDEMEEEDDEFAKFKRWENYWETRVDAQGNFPSADILWKEWESYKSKKAFQRTPVTANWSFEGPSTFTFAGVGGGIGRVNCIAFHPTLPNTFWVGTPDGGLWKTDDAGATWSTTTDDLPVLGISDIAIDYSNPNIIYIATGDGETALLSPGSVRSIGVLKSTDGGITFNATGLSIALTSQKLIHRIIMHPTNPQILMIAASDGIWRTTNGGTSWTNQQAGWFSDLEYKPGDPNYVYASTLSSTGNSQIFRSVNSGIAWPQVTPISGANRMDVALTPAVPNVVSALCADTDGLGGFEGIYSSNNSGATFTFVMPGNCTNNMLGRKYNASDCGGQGIYDLSYAIHPTNPSEVWVAGINIWKTTNGGASWNLNTMNTTDTILNPNNVPYQHSDKHKTAFHPFNPSYVYSCSDAGIHVTNDGGATWYDLSNGLGISQMYRIGTSATTAGKVLCGLQDNGLKLRSASGWNDISSGDNMEEIIDPLDTNIQYSCGLTGLLYRTLDNWATTTLVAYNIPGVTAYITANGIGPGAWISPFAMDPANNQTLYLGLNELWKTTDRGNTWAAISSFGNLATLKAMAVAPSNNQVIYTSTYDTLFITSNGGSSWIYKTITSITGNPANKISYITVNPNDPAMLWLTISGFDAGNKVFKSINGGLSWTNISGTLPNIPANCSVYQNGNDGMYVGTDLGVYYRDNTLSDWIPFNTGLPNVQVNELDISIPDSQLRAATFGRGLWKSDLYSSVGIQEEMNDNAVSLFPNPSEGIITVQLKNIVTANLELVNLLGETVFNTSLSASKTELDLLNYATGIYIVKIRSGKRLYVKKLVIK